VAIRLSARPVFLAALLLSVLVSTGCDPLGGSAAPAPESTRSSGSKISNATPPRRTGAARSLPSLADAPFRVNEVDLDAQSKPAKVAVRMIKQAVGDADAPRFEVEGVLGVTPGRHIQQMVELAAAATTCLQRKGHLALRAFSDVRYPYSMSIALVVDGQAFRDVDVARCAMTSSIPNQAAPAPEGTPTIAPCVGKRRTGRVLVTWVGTTDLMCDALGDPVAPVERVLFRGSAGTDVARLQLALNNIGNNVPVDGRLGQDTAVAIRAFQDCYAVGSSRLGVADAITQDALTMAQTSGWSTALCAPLPPGEPTAISQP
jgi:hypothetical protein